MRFPSRSPAIMCPLDIPPPLFSAQMRNMGTTICIRLILQSIPVPFSGACAHKVVVLLVTEVSYLTYSNSVCVGETR